MQTPERVYRVSPDFVNMIPMNEFNTIQRAIDRVPDYNEGIIKLEENFTAVPELSLGTEVDIVLDGQGYFGIDFTTDIATLVDQGLSFRNMAYINGDEISVVDSNIGFYNCEDTNTYLTLTTGGQVEISHTNFYGNGNPAITVNSSDSEIELFYSYIKGGYTYPAILFNVASDDKLKVKHSVLLHGSGNTPIQLGGIFDVGVHIYDSVSNKRICTNKLISWIYEDSCKSDIQITF